MTRIQLIDLIKSHSKYFTEDGTADDVATVRYNELADAILALPIDVPGDDEIKEWAEDNYTGKIKLPEIIAFYSADWMRSEILKRNRP